MSSRDPTHVHYGRMIPRSDLPEAASPITPAPTGWTTRHFYALFVAVAGALNAVLFSVFAVAALRQGPVEFLREDGPLENLTVGLYLVALVLALWGIRVVDRRRRWIAVSVAALAVFFALEELSYGERFIGYQVPTVLGVRFDAAHDIVDIGVEGWRLAMSERPVLTLVVTILLAGLAGWSCWRFRRSIAATAARMWSDPAVRFVALAFALNVFAVVADFGGEISRAIVLLEESAEATASLAVVFAALTLLRPVADDPGTHE